MEIRLLGTAETSLLCRFAKWRGLLKEGIRCANIDDHVSLEHEEHNYDRVADLELAYLRFDSRLRVRLRIVLGKLPARIFVAFWLMAPRGGNNRVEAY